MLAADAPHAVTVTGTTADGLGHEILPFEHLFFDHSSRFEPSTSLELSSLRDEECSLGRLSILRQYARHSLANLRAPPRDVLASELADFLAGRPRASACTIVDATYGPARDLAGLLSLAEETGVNIIASAGLTVDEASALFRTDEEEAAEALDAAADQLVAELTKGAEINFRPRDASAASAATHVRCGMLVAGEGAHLPPDSQPRTAILRVVGQAQMRTGAPLLVALPAHASRDGGRAVLALVRSLVSEHGATSACVLIGHAQNLLVDTAASASLASPPPEQAVAAFRELLSLGCCLCFDGFGASWGVAGFDDAASHDSGAPGGTLSGPLALLPPSDRLVARVVVELLASGFTDQIVLSLGSWSRLHFAAFGGGGLSYLRSSVVPLLRSGLGQRCLGQAEDAAMHAVLAGNAARLLSWWRPAEKPPRLVKTWECSGCHRRFEEAANPAEALPDDHVYYEKKDMRYCGMPCLSAHRKAGFALPFACQPPPE